MAGIAMCTCNKGTKKGGSKFFPTKPNKKGICTYCGYHVVWGSSYELFPKSNTSIGGYKKVCTKHTKEWGTAMIQNYFSDFPYEIFIKGQLPGKKEVNKLSKRVD